MKATFWLRQSRWCKHQEILFSFANVALFSQAIIIKRSVDWDLFSINDGFVMTCKIWEIQWNIQSLTLTVNISFKVLPKFVRFCLLHLNVAIFNTCSLIQLFSSEMTVFRNPPWASQSISLKIQLAPWNSFEKVMVTSVSGSAPQTFSPQQFSSIPYITNQVWQQF